MTYEELTPDERQYYNRLDAGRKERYLKTMPIVRGAMEAVDAGEKGLPHPRLINWEEKRVAWENRVILAEEKRIAAEANRVYAKVEIEGVFRILCHGKTIANRLKNDYSRSPDMWQRSIAGCYQNNVAWLYYSVITLFSRPSK